MNVNAAKTATKTKRNLMKPRIKQNKKKKKKKKKKKMMMMMMKNGRRMMTVVPVTHNFDGV